jgi:hypothetical protein
MRGGLGRSGCGEQAICQKQAHNKGTHRFYPGSNPLIRHFAKNAAREQGTTGAKRFLANAIGGANRPAI